MAGDDAKEDRSLLRELVTLPRAEWVRVLGRLTFPQARELLERWPMWARDGQLEPDDEPLVWMVMAGRGFGKTRAGAEWLSEMARRNPRGRLALVGATAGEVQRVMIEGPSGLIAVARTGERVSYLASKGEVHFESGAVAHVYSAAAAEALRGPEHEAAWCDELGKWRAPGGERAWDNLMLGMRRGSRPRVLVTTTPRANRLVRRVESLAKAGKALTRGRTVDNPHLPETFLEAMLAEYGGTRHGRQELDGELIGEAEGALWQRGWIEAGRMRDAPALTRVVVGVDPPASAEGDACGIVAVGLGADGRGYVLEDASRGGCSPEGWARLVAACAARHGADRVVAEKNQGGDMVESVLRAVEQRMPLTLVSASRGKSARAEPVSALYERGKVAHVGAWPELEDELCGLLIGGGYEGPGRSPDRADALVWAVAELMLRRKRVPGVRGL